MDGYAILQAILDSPDDDDLRQVYADWCEENSLGPRAARIRRGLDGEEVSEEYLHHTLVFRRGFAEELIATCAAFLIPAVLQHFAWQPIQRVRLTDREPSAAVASLPSPGGPPLAVVVPGWRWSMDGDPRPAHVYPCSVYLPPCLAERLRPTHPRQGEVDDSSFRDLHRHRYWIYNTVEEASADLSRAALEHGVEHGLRLREAWRRELALRD